MPADSVQFWIGLSSTLAPVARIIKIDSASLNLQLNNGGTVSLTVDASEVNATYFASPLTYCLFIYRDGNLVWSGPLWTMRETHSEAYSNKIEITAIGWFELLNHRVIRSQPGYSLTTSAITFTNATFESAVSGWAVSLSTAARDTVTFRSGAGSFGWVENRTGPFGKLITDGSNSLAFTSATPLGSTPTANKRYKLNFYARGRKRPSDVGGAVPYLEVLESGSRVAVLSFENLFNPSSYTNNYSNGGWTPTTISADGQGTPVAAFLAQTLEWVSSGLVPTLKFGWDLNPTQLIGGDGSSTSSWTPSGNSYVTTDGIGSVYASSTTNSTDIITQNWNGTFVSGKVYKMTARVNDAIGGLVSGSITMNDGTIAGSSLGSVSLAGIATSGLSTVSFTWTATSSQPVLSVSGTWPSGYSGQLLQIADIIISENATDTDPLLNIDDVTLQEYAGDGIYANMDAGAIASALLQKANADGATKIVPGSVQTTQPRTRTYQQFSNVGQEIKSLSDIESGYDFFIDPATRALNIYNRTNATNFPAVTSGQAGGDGSLVYSADRTGSLRFDYKEGKDNLASLSRTIDSSTVVNRLNVQGKYALGFAQDTTSQTNYGIFEDLISLPDVVDATSSSVLPYYANAEISFRKNPKISYEIELKTGVSPKLFIDFNIGDRGIINAPLGTLVGGAGLAQTVRIFGVQLSIDSEGNEKISNLQLSA